MTNLLLESYQRNIVAVGHFDEILKTVREIWQAVTNHLNILN
jgi:hypothetical protein